MRVTGNNPRICTCNSAGACKVCRERAYDRQRKAAKSSGNPPGRPPTCECGECRLCKHRVIARNFRKRHGGQRARPETRIYGK
jgi:hypothetical protein